MSHQFEKLVHLIKLSRFGGATNGSPFSPLHGPAPIITQQIYSSISSINNLFFAFCRFTLHAESDADTKEWSFSLNLENDPILKRSLWEI
jgi:hypothetical protein